VALIRVRRPVTNLNTTVVGSTGLVPTVLRTALPVIAGSATADQLSSMQEASRQLPATGAPAGSGYPGGFPSGAQINRNTPFFPVAVMSGYLNRGTPIPESLKNAPLTTVWDSGTNKNVWDLQYMYDVQKSIGNYQAAQGLPNRYPEEQAFETASGFADIAAGSGRAPANSISNTSSQYGIETETGYFTNWEGTRYLSGAEAEKAQKIEVARMQQIDTVAAYLKTSGRKTLTSTGGLDPYGKPKPISTYNAGAAPQVALNVYKIGSTVPLYTANPVVVRKDMKSQTYTISGPASLQQSTTYSLSANGMVSKSSSSFVGSASPSRTYWSL
jgi:hypothetical protein